METNGIDLYRYLMNIRHILSVDKFGAYIVTKKKRLRGGCRRKGVIRNDKTMRSMQKIL